MIPGANPSLADRKYNAIKLLGVRSMTMADLDLLRHKLPPPCSIKTLRDRHHHMAWLIALGKPNDEIAVECRINPSRLSTLKLVPAFAELINRYRAEIEAGRLEAARDFGAKAARTRELAEDLVIERLEAARDGNAPMPAIKDLNRIAVDRMDRTGYGKINKNLNVNVDFAAKLEAAIARTREVA